jgi:hypothetical protein
METSYNSLECDSCVLICPGPLDNGHNVWVCPLDLPDFTVDSEGRVVKSYEGRIMRSYWYWKE